MQVDCGPLPRGSPRKGDGSSGTTHDAQEHSEQTACIPPALRLQKVALLGLAAGHHSMARMQDTSSSRGGASTHAGTSLLPIS